MKRIVSILSCGAALLFAACGGGGGGGGGVTKYAISGTISGLTANGLVLRMNYSGVSDMVTKNTGDATFTFPTSLASGTAYQVSVQTSPNNLNCVISNASGTVASANVTNIAVTCTAAPTYRLSGTISGLAATGMILQFNGGNDVSPDSASASGFTFTSQLAGGRSYTVTLKRHPWGQYCSLTNATGTVGAADVTNIAVSCSAWIATHAQSSTLAGKTLSGYVSPSLYNATGALARFSSPSGVALDSSGNLYVADTGNDVIRKISSSGVVTTFAGAGDTGAADGAATVATFNNPTSVAVDSSNNVYVADSGNHKIRKITVSTGVVSTLAGSGTAGAANGAGAAASFNTPNGVAVDSSGNVYVADTNNHLIRKITSAGVVSTFAGTGTVGAADGAATTAAQFSYPQGVAVDALGNVYVADTLNCTIRMIPRGFGSVVTMAGDSTHYGPIDGTGSNATFSYPNSLTVDSSGNVYVADTYNHLIRKVTPSGAMTVNTGVVTIYAGTKLSAGLVDHSFPTSASFNYPRGIAIDSSGNLYVADSQNHAIRKILALFGRVTTLAGSSNAGSSEGAGATAGFNYPWGITADSDNNLYVADMQNDKIRKISSSGVVSTLAGAGLVGNANGAGYSALFASPYGVAVDSSSNIYVADTLNNQIRKISPTGVVTLFAGDSDGASDVADGNGSAARFKHPKGIAIDAADNLYVADTDNFKIRKITPAGDVTTLAGSGAGTAAVDATGAAADFVYPLGITVDSAGNIYVADTGANKIRKITAAGVVTTFAGGTRGLADGQGTAAQFYYPYAVAADPAGNLYVGDGGNRMIRKITPAGVVTTLIGNGNAGYANGSTAQSTFYYLGGITVDADGNLAVTDAYNNNIRKITRSP